MSDVNGYIDIISNLGALGLVFWLILRTHNHTIPRLAQSFEDAITQQREAFREMAAQEREDFHSNLLEHREFFAAQMERERQVNGQQVDKLVEALKDLTVEVRRFE